MAEAAFRSGSKCAGCTSAYNRSYYRANRGHILAHVKAARTADVDAARLSERERSGRHYRANKAKRRESVSRWEAKNPGARTARKRLRDAQTLSATPPWVDRQALQHVYAIARLIGHHVDHIVPLRHPLVCGLHVPWNLQILSPTENLAKSNKFEPWKEDQ